MDTSAIAFRTFGYVENAVKNMQSGKMSVSAEQKLLDVYQYMSEMIEEYEAEREAEMAKLDAMSYCKRCGSAYEEPESGSDSVGYCSTHCKIWSSERMLSPESREAHGEQFPK